MIKERISGWQFFLLTLNYAVGTALFVRPGGMISAAKQDGWMIPLFSGGFALIVVFLWIALAKANPESSLVQICLKAGGKTVGGLFALLYIWYFVQTSSWVTRNLGDFMKTILMHNTPISVFHIMILAVAGYAVIKGIETIARISEFLTPFIVFVLIVIYLLTLTEWNWMRFEPPFQAKAMEIVEASLPIIGFPFLECIALLMLVPNVTSGLKSGLLLGFITATSLLTGIVFITIGVLGVTRTSHFMYPLYIIVQELQVAEFIEHVESTIVIVWLIWIFLKLCIAYYCAVAGICELFQVKDRTWITVPLLLLIAGLALTIHENVVENVNWDKEYIFKYSCLYGIIVPALLLLVTRWRKKHKGKGETS
ncbi:GerAB/ArcD/ProY family transporter [Cohnella abietis]|uniref:Germination protein n=1 Tax=Cohnella abietis TaxID=2507935 RepID=A0A3T1DEZ1_9BACL|nr:endospore germination permease [Cohnella abietis]BBI36584.1 germination protein [Cohnella abietis]